MRFSVSRIRDIFSAICPFFPSKVGGWLRGGFYKGGWSLAGMVPSELAY